MDRRSLTSLGETCPRTRLASVFSALLGTHRTQLDAETAPSALARRAKGHAIGACSQPHMHLIAGQMRAKLVSIWSNLALGRKALNTNENSAHEQHTGTMHSCSPSGQPLLVARFTLGLPLNSQARFHVKMDVTV